MPKPSKTDLSNILLATFALSLSDFIGTRWGPKIVPPPPPQASKPHACARAHAHALAQHALAHTED
eukprot:5276798-Amphidinium_carterae.1